MPFQSEKQRKYLWANEPEIAREWTDKYGSRVRKATGGLGALYEGWEGLGNPFPTAISQFGNYLTGGNNITNLSDIAPTGSYQDVLQQGILQSLNRQSGLNQGDFSRLVKATDYGGHKIGESFKSADTPVQFASMLPAGLPRELLEMVKVGIGDPTSNIANTLGDFQFEYKPPVTDFDEDYMGIKDKYNFPTSNFYPGKQFNISGEITDRERKREIRNAIFDLQAKQRASNLAKINQDEEETYIDPHRIPGRIQKSVPRKMGMLERFRNKFYKPAAGAVNYGGKTYSPAQLNSMNALGGYYSEPAREGRRLDARRTNILNRAAKGKPVGNVNLLGPNYRSDGKGGISYTGPGPSASQKAAGATSRSDDSWSSSTFRRGGLASLWQR
jgi:hypothetical protein